MKRSGRAFFVVLAALLMSGVLLLTGCTRIPSAPNDLSAHVADTAANLSWTPVSGATEYAVSMATVSGGPYTAVTNTSNDASYQVTGLTNGTRYYFVIQAGNSAGWSGYSNEASVTPNPPPPAPTGLSALAGNAKVTLNWNASPGANSYAVYGSTTSGGGYTFKTATNGSTSCDVTGLTNNTTYYFVVTAGGPNGWSGYSNEASATPKGVVYAMGPLNIGFLMSAGMLGRG